MDPCSSITSCFRTTSPRRAYLLRSWCACYKPSLMRMETPGFIVLGPDYFFGVPVQNLQPDRDKIAWSLEARAAAVEVFPKWFERAKATYGGAPPTSRPSDTLLSCFCFLGVETTKYIAVGKCATVARFVEGSNRRMSFQATVSAHRSCWIWPQRGLLWQVLLPTPASSRTVISRSSPDPSYFRVQRMTSPFLSKHKDVPRIS
jgi:hypothetical protein